MHKQIQLSENHTRTLSSSLKVVAKSLSELEDILSMEAHTCCNVIQKDVDVQIIEDNIYAIREAKSYICELAEKYGTSRENLSLKRVINAKRTKIWEILTDSLSQKIKGYGTFPKKYSGEYDADINKLIEITNKISY